MPDSRGVYVEHARDATSANHELGIVEIAVNRDDRSGIPATADPFEECVEARLEFRGQPSNQVCVAGCGFNRAKRAFAVAKVRYAVQGAGELPGMRQRCALRSEASPERDAGHILK